MTRYHPSSAVFFPLSSNAHALIAGGPVESVRGRLKMASLLYDQVWVESGQRRILAGPRGAVSMGHPPGPDGHSNWQSSGNRHGGQAGPFTVSFSPEHEPGVRSQEPYQEVTYSQASICWLPTLEPFRRELPGDCDWVEFGFLRPDPALKELAARWKRLDKKSAALESLVPEAFVRSTLIDHITKDLAVGALGGLDVSVDRLHGKVVEARFANEAALEPRGVALPILVPQIGRCGWDEVATIRRMRALGRLREVLREVEIEAFEVGGTGGDVEAAMRHAYDKKLRGAIGEVESIGLGLSHAVVELVVGTVIGYATLGLAMAAPLVGAAAGAGISTTWRVREMVRQRREKGWVGVMSRISDSVSN